MMRLLGVPAGCTTPIRPFLKRHGRDFALFGQNASRIDPHTYDVVYLDEPGDG